MENNYEGYNYAVKYIMRSRLSGIRGVVAELMEVPAGYETAVETALGAQMQNIICDDDAGAKKAILLLKENKAGRLTFLPSASIRGSRASVDRRIQSDPGYKGLGADCIRCEDRYRHIFDYLLGRVVVTTDMDAAVRLSKIAGNGLRFVTLDGEIINAGGAITGGKYKNKTANLLERRNEIASLEREISRIAEEMKQAAAAQTKAAEKLKHIDFDLSRLTADQRNAELEKVSFESAVKGRIDAQKRRDGNSRTFSSLM